MAAILRSDFARVAVGLVTSGQRGNLQRLHDWLIDEVGLIDDESAVAATNYQQGRFGRLPNHVVILTTHRLAYTHDKGLRGIPIRKIDTSRVGLNAGIVNGEISIQLHDGETLTFRRGASLSMQEMVTALTSSYSPPTAPATTPAEGTATSISERADEALEQDVHPPRGEWTSGSGDDIVTFQTVIEESIGYLEIEGNRGGDYFAVWSLGPDLQESELLVNRIKPYRGVVALGLQGPVAGLKVDARGSWKLRFRNWDEIPVMQDGLFQGVGDGVVRMHADPLHVGEAGVARINIGPPEDEAVSVWAVGDSLELLVNDISPYSGGQIIPAGTRILIVNAPGQWSVSGK